MIDRYSIINRLPYMELSYDPITHKKVRADVFGLIPNGCNVLAWFTYNLSDNVCILLYINKYNIVTKTEQIVLCFNKELAYGTIIAGTYFNHKNQNFLVCEDIYYFKGEYIQNCDFKIKYNILTDILNNYIQQKAYTNKFVIFCLPVFTKNLYLAFERIKTLEYKIAYISCYNWTDKKSIGLLINKQISNIETVFKIKANIEQDIYSLYCRNDEDLYGYAGIFNYKTSIMMNNLFRTIKENRNLDLLEMSDDEEEFENIQEDKYVNMTKIVYMKCVFNRKFKKWVPVEKVQFGEKLLSKYEIQKLECNNR